jgi:hypothetical protein
MLNNLKTTLRKLMTDLFARYTQGKDMGKPRALQLTNLSLVDEGNSDDQRHDIPMRILCSAQSSHWLKIN